MLSHRILTRSALATLVLSLSVPALAAGRQQRAAVARRAARNRQAGPAGLHQPGPGRQGNAGNASKSSSRSCRPPSAGSSGPTRRSSGTSPTWLRIRLCAAFLKQHPEIRSSPGFFFEHIGPMEFWSPSQPETRESQAIRVWRDILQFLRHRGRVPAVTGALIWIIRTLVEYRRWHRTSKVHTEVHNKLMDRFTANEDLLAYMQTPAGAAVPGIGAAVARGPLPARRRASEPHPVVGAGRRRARRRRARAALREQPGHRRSRAAALRHRCARAGGRRRLRRVGRRVIPPLAAPGPLRTARRRRASTSRERGP